MPACDVTPMPRMLGHLLTTPRRHADTWADLTDEEAAQVGIAAAALGRGLRGLTAAERIYSAVMGHHSPQIERFVNQLREQLR